MCTLTTSTKSQTFKHRNTIFSYFFSAGSRIPVTLLFL